MGLAGAAAGSLVGGLLGGALGGSGGAPSRKVVQLDPDTERMIGGANLEAQRSAEDIQKDLTKGVGGTEVMDQPIMTGDEPGMGRAIQAKYKSMLGEDLSRIQTGTEIEARQKQVSNQARAMNFNIAKKNARINNAAKMMEAQVAEERLRSQLLGNILGGAGQMIGYGMGTGDIKFGGKASVGSGWGSSPGAGQSYLGGNQMAGELGRG